ncbi:membrane-bound PQQ-dependent dehydrogenase, glucose/quinate/shikimate family [Brackiella oedipodis]|uniref:membrane-bound PQQ-dependent dehydrogenase, glucose/quinate/shikimate family n=1 Tax=Brackiella oedipodis TaxID=124225 RepID=UPI00048D4278|nr:membrane-bound PQQ-dependent dehydrogenase, glucose/quinate/shikimate family [Brackiella oedipodis]
MLNKITSLIMLVIGVVLAYMGWQVLNAGAGPFYLVTSIGLIFAAILLFTNSRFVLTFYALLMWVTLGWIIYQVGFDKWQWIPRGDVIAVIGLWLALPWTVRRVNKPHDPKNASGFHPFLGSTVIIMLIMTVVIAFYDAYPTKGELANERVDLDNVPSKDWSSYGGDLNGRRFSALKQINNSNAKDLVKAWEYHTGDIRDPKVDASEYTFEVNPLKVNGLLYICTPHAEVHALNPQTGELAWKFVPPTDPSNQRQHQTCRGVSYYDLADMGASDSRFSDAKSTETPAAQTCQKRIYNSTPEGELFALDANTGEVCTDFADNGKIDLKKNLGEVRPHTYMVTSPPVVADGLVIINASVTDNAYNKGNPGGVLRAFDARTGKLVWNFNPAHPDDTTPIAEDGVYDHDTPISWPDMSADIQNGLIYVPYGNYSPDQIGVNRDMDSAKEQFRDALVALDIKTGHLKWKFQTTYHDLWDRDNPSQPPLADIDYKGQKRQVVFVPTKVGNIFVLDRLTGEPVYPVTQKEVSTDGVIPGERPSPTQPVSALNFTPKPLSIQDMWGTSPFDHMQCQLMYHRLRYDHNAWTPPSTKEILLYPGNIGVFNWGSVAIDPERQLLVAAPIRLPYQVMLEKRKGDDLTKRIFTKEGDPVWNENMEGQYSIKIQNMVSATGAPCSAPPWGTLVGVDLKTGKTAWQRRIGNTKNLKTNFLPFGFPIPFTMGMVAHGGAVITAGDIVIQGATADDYFHVYDLNTGKTLWQTELSAGAQSTPTTYEGDDGVQYIVIAAGGHGSLGTTPGDSVVAFKLKK